MTTIKDARTGELVPRDYRSEAAQQFAPPVEQTPEQKEEARQTAILQAEANAKMTEVALEYEIEQVVTRPVLKQTSNVGFAVIFEGAACEMPALEGVQRKYPTPIRLAEVLELPTREPRYLVMNTVLESELGKAFPNLGYVGHAFAILPMERAGKNYRIYAIKKLRLRGDGRPEAVGATIGKLQEAQS